MRPYYLLSHTTQEISSFYFLNLRLMLSWWFSSFFFLFFLIQKCCVTRFLRIDTDDRLIGSRRCYLPPLWTTGLFVLPPMSSDWVWKQRIKRGRRASTFAFCNFSHVLTLWLRVTRSLVDNDVSAHLRRAIRNTARYGDFTFEIWSLL